MNHSVRSLRVIMVAAAGRSEGLVFNHDRMVRTPNTIGAHRLIWLAGQQGKQGSTFVALRRRRPAPKAVTGRLQFFNRAPNA